MGIPGKAYKSMSADDLAQKWKDKKTKFPKIPFGFIAVYQFCVPMMPIILLDWALYQLYISLEIAGVWIILSLPFILIANYIGYIWCMAFSCKILNKFYDRKSPPQTGVFRREFSENGMEDPVIHYYHLRGYLYKLPVFLSKKSFFPWMVNYVLREISNNKIHKNAIIGDAFVGLEYSDLDENAVMMDSAIMSSHVVDSIFGNLSIYKVKLDPNAVLQPGAVMAPGAEVKDTIGPRSFCVKNWTNKNPDAEYLWGVPPKKYRKKRIEDLLPLNLQQEFEKRYS